MALTKVEQLRQKYDTTKIQLVDLVRLFDPTKNRLLTDLLMQHYLRANANQVYAISERVWNKLNFDTNEDAAVLKSNYTLYIMLDVLHSILGEDTFYFLERFNKYWTEDKLPNRDITAYKSWEDIKNVVYILDLEEHVKDKTVQIYKLHETDEWLIVAPLSFKASQIYGSGTKWCTTNRDSAYSFWKYTQDGFLLYIINKKINMKYAYHRMTDFNGTKEPGQVNSEFFNAADVRVDSMDLDIPYELYDIVHQFLRYCNQDGIHSNSDFPNYDWDGYAEFQSTSEQKDSPMAENNRRPHLRVVRENITEAVPTEEPVDENGTAIMVHGDQPTNNGLDNLARA
jgi:hypothetical protein